MTLVESKIKQLVDNVQVDAQGWIEEMDSLTWVGGTGRRNPFYRKHHPPEIMERIRQANIGRPKTAAERAKLSAASLGENNGFYDKHHTDASKRKSVETRTRNGTLGYFPEKTITLLRIAKELYDAGVDRKKIASLALKQMRENGLKMSKVHAYRVLPQEYKNPKQVVSSSSSKKRERMAKLKALGLQITPSSATERCIECGSNTTGKNWKGQPVWYRPGRQYQCTRCYLKRYVEANIRRPDVRTRSNEDKKRRRVKRKALGLPYQ